MAAQDDLKKRTPFHAAVEHNAMSRQPNNKLDVVVRELLRISPEATSLLDHDGRNPLMVETIGKACFEVVKLLLEANEASAS